MLSDGKYGNFRNLHVAKKNIGIPFKMVLTNAENGMEKNQMCSIIARKVPFDVRKSVKCKY